jgi:hypothetical protein
LTHSSRKKRKKQKHLAC